MEFRKDVGPNEWDDFLAVSGQSSCFVEPWFLDCLDCNYCFCVGYKKGKPVVGAPILLDEEGKPILRAVAFCMYNGLLFSDVAKKTHSRYPFQFTVAEEFLQRLEDEFGEYFLCNHWGLEDLRPFLWHNYHNHAGRHFETSLRYTAILDLSAYANFDELLSGVRSVRRQEYGKRMKDETIVVREVDDFVELDELHKLTFARQGIVRPDQDGETILGLAENSVRLNKGMVLGAFAGEQMVAATLFLTHKNSCYYLLSATDPEYRSSFSTTLLVLKNIEFFMNRGLKFVDFIGANSPNRGDFKLSFNAELRPYFHTLLR